MKILGIIPARLESVRFPQKMLCDIKGKTLIQRTYESASKSSILSKLIVATDSTEIFHNVKKINGDVFLNKKTHQSGTSRIMEVIDNFPEYDYYLNIQGDHPIFTAEPIDSMCIKLLEKEKEQFPVVVTPVVKIKEVNDIYNYNSVKVVFNINNEALYFSRNTIPYIREKNEYDVILQSCYFKHLGFYGFNKLAVQKIKEMSMSMLERAEALEQLTWLYHGIKIFCVEVNNDVYSVDLKEDLNNVLRLLEK